MPSSCMSPKTLDDVFNAIILEVTSVTDLPPRYEEAMKTRLLELMADGERWDRDPEAVRAEFWDTVTTMLGQRAHS